VNIAIVYEPLPDLGPDPMDEAKMPRRLGDFISSGMDAFVVWREYGDQFEGGWRDHIVGQGIWENLTTEQIEQALGWLQEGLPE
jgi:hypothetical protein